jgi:hypothetical protein
MADKRQIHQLTSFPGRKMNRHTSHRLKMDLGRIQVCEEEPFTFQWCTVEHPRRRVSQVELLILGSRL